MVHDSQLPRSCDRCHSLKERCRRATSTSACDRCLRLRLACVSNRPFKRPGRRPQPYYPSSSSSSPSSPLQLPHRSQRQHQQQHQQQQQYAFRSQPSDILALFSVPDRLSQEEAWLVHRAMADNTFIEQFLVGPSFGKAHRETILNQLSTSPALVQDAYMACVLSVPHPAEDPEGTNTEQRITTSFRRASSALAKLRSLQIAHARDISSCLALGGCILAFVLRFGGKDSLAICAQVLGLIKPAYDSQLDRIQIPQADLGFLTCLIMCETTECLLQTEVPTLRYRPPAAGSPGFVDRYIGLCGTLLPHLYDLCERGNQLFHGVDAGREQLDGLERVLDAWRPPVPAGFADDYTSPEITNMLCQAHVMQQAAMLVLHRLRFPFGTEQIAALAMANNIFRLLDTAKSVSGRAIRCIDFALMVACLEIACEKQRSIHLRAVSSIAVYSPRFIQRSEAFLTAIWEARNSSTRPIFWYHLGSIAKHIRLADVPGV